MIEDGNCLRDLIERDFVESEDELRSLHESEDDDGEYKPVKIFQEKNLYKDGFRFFEGMIFNSSLEFKWAVTEHELLRKKDIWFQKNESIRVRALCKHAHCNWTLFASKPNPDVSFTIKTYKPEHSCGDQQENSALTSGFLARHFRDEFKNNTAWGRKPFQSTVKSKFNCLISKHKSYRAKKLALKHLQGQDSEQMKLLWDYLEELRTSNPGTTAKMKVDSEFSINGRPRFERVYICYGACKEGFLGGCRPLIGVDGCFLKGPQKGGQLLSAIGVDANNSMFPVAFAIVEGETKETWKWFLELLNTDLGIMHTPGAWTLLSDKQKGLIPAVEELLPGVEHRFCVRHMHANFVKDGFGGQKLKQQLWAICKATTQATFNNKIQELRDLNPAAADWVAAREPEHYCRAFFNDFPKSDMILNNLCESWNSTILNFRDKSILTMLENIRIYLMTRMQKNREKMQELTLRICPKIMQIFEDLKPKANDCWAYKSIGDLYQVDDGYQQKYKVDLSEHKCSCRRWDLNGIPCAHAIACIRKKGENPIDYIHDCYTVDAYIRAYSPAILPIKSSDKWKKTGLSPPIPPKYKVQPGRPTKKRKLGPAEIEKGTTSGVKKGRVGQVKKCSVCGGRGHNKTSCKAKKKQVENAAAHNDPVQVEDNLSVFDAFENVQVETQVPTFVLNEMEFMASQSTQTNMDGSQRIQTSNFIAASTSSAGQSVNQMENFISRGGRNYVTLSALQQGLGSQQNTNKGKAKKQQPKKKN